MESEPTLEDVRKLAEQVRDETQSWYRELDARGVDQIKLGRAAALVEAMTSSTQLLADVLEGFHDDMRRNLTPDREWPREMMRGYAGHSNTNYVAVPLKAWLFDVRALQDALGRLLSAIAGRGDGRPIRAGMRQSCASRIPKLRFRAAYSGDRSSGPNATNSLQTGRIPHGHRRTPVPQNGNTPGCGFRGRFR